MNDLNFLRLIFELGGSFQNVNNIDLAIKANVSKASVSDRTQHLSKLGLVKYTRYYGTKLTKHGLNSVIPLIQQQRLIEIWLYEKLNIPINNIYEKSCSLSEHPDLLLIDRLNTYLDYPTVCPHGNVVPINCEIPEFPKDSLLFDQSILHTKLQITNFTEDDYLFKTLNNIDIKLNDMIEVINLNDYDHSMVVLNLRTGLKQILPKNITKMIHIKYISPKVKNVK